MQLADARLVARAPRDTLILPRGPARLRLYVIGRAADGLLVGSRGALLFWTDRPGVLVVRVSGRDLRIGARHVHGAAILRLPVCRAGRFAIGVTTTIDRIIAGRPAGGRMSLPRFVPGSCRA